MIVSIATPFNDLTGQFNYADCFVSNSGNDTHSHTHTVLIAGFPFG